RADRFPPSFPTRRSSDLTGNLRIVASNPAIFLEARGADRDPDREPRALRSLKGAAAGRVVRALCDFMPPYGVRALAEISSTPLGDRKSTRLNSSHVKISY